MNILLQALQATGLFLLNLEAAFDTADHSLQLDVHRSSGFQEAHAHGFPTSSLALPFLMPFVILPQLHNLLTL